MKQLLLMLLAVPAFAFANPYKVEVVKVVDGDTITIKAPYLPIELKQELKIRVLGVDTPEKAPRAQCEQEAELAKKASAHTKALIAKAKVIEVNYKSWDKYGGRALGTVIIDGVDLSKSLIDAGLARPYFGDKKESWCK